MGVYNRFERFSFAMLSIYRNWHKLMSCEMKKRGLRGNCGIYLVALSHAPGGLSAKELSANCGRNKADVSRAVSDLEKKGFVERNVADASRYRAKFSLTESGKKAAESVGKQVDSAVEIAGGDISPAEREIFYELIESIAFKLEKLTCNGLPE